MCFSIGLLFEFLEFFFVLSFVEFFLVLLLHSCSSIHSMAPMCLLLMWVEFRHRRVRAKKSTLATMGTWGGVTPSRLHVVGVGVGDQLV